VPCVKIQFDLVPSHWSLFQSCFFACCVNKPAGNRHSSRSLGCLRHPMLPLCCFSGQTPCHGTELGLEREKGALSCTNPRLTLDATDDLSSLMQGLSIWGERQFLAVFLQGFSMKHLALILTLVIPRCALLWGLILLAKRQLGIRQQGESKSSCTIA